MLHKSKHARTRSAGLVGVLLAVGGATLVLSVAATGTASAAVLGSISVRPLTGTDATLFGGSIANAQCPAKTGDSFFSMEGPGIRQGEAFLGPSTNVTGTGPQEFSGASIANLKTNNAGSFATTSTYVITFNCIRDPDGAITDTYQRRLNYVAGGAGSYTIETVSAPSSPSPSASPAASVSPSPVVTASPVVSASPVVTASPAVSSTPAASTAPSASATGAPSSTPAASASPSGTAAPSATSTSRPATATPTAGTGSDGFGSGDGGAGSGSGSGSGLPRTGFSTGLLAALGLTVLAAGAALTAAGRRQGWFPVGARETSHGA